MKNITKYFSSNSKPIKCFHCGSTRFYDKIIDTINNEICEKERCCKECGKTLNVWSYGNWDPVLEDEENLDNPYGNDDDDLIVPEVGYED